MKVISRPRIAFLLFLFVALIFLSARSSGAQKATAKKYPEGFSLKHPKSWTARMVDRKFIWIGSRAEEPGSGFILVYPFFLKEKAGSRSWLEKNLSILPKNLTQVNIQRLEQIRSFPDEVAARFLFLRNNVPHEGVALCSIFEKSGILYVMASGRESFEAERSHLLSVLESFRFESPEEGTSVGASTPKIAYASWKDPVEGAFTLEVPQGWNISGGTFRRAAVDLVHVLQAASPDQKICIQFNDQNLPIFAIPSQMLAWAGFKEGSWYSPGYGVNMLVKRYIPGHYFLIEYLQQNYQPRLGQFRVVSQKERSDVVSNFNRIYSQFASYGISYTLHAGESAFGFAQNSEPYIGYGLALTQVVKSTAMQGGNWSVALMIIFTCPEGEAERVQELTTHMFQSLRMNPAWVASQQQLAGNVSQIVTQTNQEICRIIDESYWTRQATLDDINRKFSNYILGVGDVVDPVTGEKWKVEAGHNYYWRKDYTDQIVGTETAQRPDINFSLLREF
jgi:hypothetical protein